MKIIKLIKNNKQNHYFVMFDKIPEITYERMGSSYVGSATDSDGNIIASNYLGYDRYPGAFASRELTLTMKDGSIQKIKDYWYDCGSYKKHGEFINIGAKTLEQLQECFVFYSYNINKNTFFKMVEEYLKHDKIYEYDEVREWVNLQYEWFDVIVHGKKIPFMMNEKGDMVEKETKKRVFARYNKCKKVNGKCKKYTYFRFEYKGEDGRLIKLEANYIEVLKATLPFTEKEIKEKCKVK